MVLKYALGLLFLLILAGFLERRILQIHQARATSTFDRCRVIAVYDGDTIRVRFKNGLSRKVRLIGIDAPETGAKGEKERFKAFMAKRFTFFHLFGKEVKISYDWEIEDKYQRLLAYVWTDGEDLFNTFLLREGFAKALQHIPFREDYRKEFILAEQEAHKRGKGIWNQGAFPLISLKKWKDAVGKIVTVVFLCSQVEKRSKFLFLRDAGGEFAALIPEENISLFPELKENEGKKLAVIGFLEVYKNKPQILVFLPMQIQRIH
ncbi:MAG: thermonuclease family protein [Candidatus Aminicenantales bacterium]